MMHSLSRFPRPAKSNDAASAPIGPGRMMNPLLCFHPDLGFIAPFLLNDSFSALINRCNRLHESFSMLKALFQGLNESLRRLHAAFGRLPKSFIMLHASFIMRRNPFSLMRRQNSRHT